MSNEAAEPLAMENLSQTLAERTTVDYLRWMGWIKEVEAAGYRLVRSDALATERRATVARIRAAVIQDWGTMPLKIAELECLHVLAILDAEAAR